MSVASVAIDADKVAAVKAAISAKPDGVLDTIAEECGVSYRTTLDCLEGDAAVAIPLAEFETLWADMTGWGPIMFIVHTRDGVFETDGQLPPGSFGRGYFNIHGESPIGGHIKMDRCAAIYFVDRPFFGRRSCSVQFINGGGAAMFKVFVGRDEKRELKGDQVERFEALRTQLRG